MTLEQIMRAADEYAAARSFADIAGMGSAHDEKKAEEDARVARAKLSLVVSRALRAADGVREVEAPRYREWLHLRQHGQWPNGVPAWARDYRGLMTDSTAANAVIEELAAIAGVKGVDRG